MTTIDSLPAGPLFPEEIETVASIGRVRKVEVVEECDCCGNVHAFEVTVPEGVVRFQFTGWEWMASRR